MPNYVLTAGADTDLTSKPKRLRAWHMSAGAAAMLVNLRDGSATGDIVAQIQLAINTSASQSYDHPGIFFPNGLFVDWVSGAGAPVGSVSLE